MKTLESVFRAAAADLADYMTGRLQANAIDRGWPNDAIDGISVNFNGSSVNLVIKEGYEDAVMTSEYGTQSVRPNAVIRQTANLKNEFEKVFIDQVDSRLRRLI